MVSHILVKDGIYIETGEFTSNIALSPIVV